MAHTAHEAKDVSKRAEAGRKAPFRSGSSRKAMKQPREMPWILTCLRPPALYTRLEVMQRLGLHDEDAVSKIVKKRLLPPMGNRTGKKQMWFFADEVEERAHDRRWLEKVVRVLQEGDDAEGNYSGGFLSFGEERPTVEGSAKVFEDWQPLLA